MAQNSLKVLVVEDDDKQARFIELLLKKSNPPFAVEIARDAETALKKLNHFTYDAITLDYHLPAMNGIQALQVIKQRNIQSPVIMVTGQGDELIAVQAMRQGAHDYITKTPEHLDLLPRVLARAVREHNLSKQLEYSRKRYYDLFHNANTAIFVVDAKSFIVLQMNKRAEHLLGLSEEKGKQKTFYNLCSRDSQKIAEDLFDSILNNGHATVDEVKMVGKDKANVPVDISGSLVKSGDSLVVELFANDISEKLKMQRQISLSRQRLISVFNGISDYICVIDNKFSLHMGNKKYLEYTGFTAQTLTKQKCYAALFNSTTPCKNCPAPKTYKAGSSNFLEFMHQNRIFQIWTFPMQNLEGRADYVVEYVKDVTDQKEIERQLIKSEKLASIGLLSSGIAHELRNPLSIIDTARYSIETLLEKPDREIENSIRIIKANVKRATSIIDNLLQFSRHSKFTKEKVDIELLIKTTMSLLRKEIENNKVKPIIAFANVPKAYFNLDSLKQVFLNLIQNANQAMPEGGELKIRTRTSKDKKWILINFEDNGVGISKENMENIFTPFFTTKDPTQGIGLGLYITYTLLKREGGDIIAKSVEGGGSIFTVKIPAAKEDDKPV